MLAAEGWGVDSRLDPLCDQSELSPRPSRGGPQQRRSDRQPKARLLATARERLAFSGPEGLSDHDLLVAILGTGDAQRPVTQLAQQLLEDGGGLLGLSHRGLGQLQQTRGLGFAKSARLLAALELGKRIQVLQQSPACLRLDSFESVVQWATPRLAPLPHEEVWLLGLNGQNGLTFARLIARGGMHACALTAKEVLRPAIAEGASAMVLVHNHPSGDPTPSRQDVVLTQIMDRAAKCVDVALLDHIVVASGGAQSLREFIVA